MPFVNPVTTQLPDDPVTVQVFDASLTAFTVNEVGVPPEPVPSPTITVTSVLPATAVGCRGTSGADKATVNVTALKLVEYELVVAAVARTTQLPAPVNVKTAVDEFTVQPVEPALVTEYVITPLPEVEARTEGVFGESAVDNAVVGDHETTCADTVEVVVVLVAAVVGTVGTGEGEIVTTRGTVVVVEGTDVEIRGTVVVVNGTVVATRGTVVATRGTVVATRGTVVATRGTVVATPLPVDGGTVTRAVVGDTVTRAVVGDTVVTTRLPVVGGIVTRAVVGGIVARTDVGGAGGDT